MWGILVRPWGSPVNPPTRRVPLTLIGESYDFTVDRQALEELARAFTAGGASVAVRGGARARVLSLEAVGDRLVAVVEDALEASPLVTIRLSADRRFFYVVGDLQVRLRAWLSVEKFPGPLPRERLGSIPDASWFEFAPVGGPWHHRAGFDIRTSRVVLGDQEVIEKTSELYLDYVGAARAAE